MDSPPRRSETLNFIVHFLRSEGLYAAEAALRSELREREPDGGDSPACSGRGQSARSANTSRHDLGDFEAGGAAREEAGSGCRTGSLGTPHSFDEEVPDQATDTSIWSRRHWGSLSQYTGLSGAGSRAVSSGAEVDEYEDGDDCGYVREEVRGQEAFAAHELDASDEDASRRAADVYHQALAFRKKQWEDDDEASASSDGHGSSYFSGEPLRHERGPCAARPSPSQRTVVLTDPVYPKDSPHRTPALPDTPGKAAPAGSGEEARRLTRSESAREAATTTGAAPPAVPRAPSAGDAPGPQAEWRNANAAPPAEPASALRYLDPLGMLGKVSDVFGRRRASGGSAPATQLVGEPAASPAGPGGVPGEGEPSTGPAGDEASGSIDVNSALGGQGRHAGAATPDTDGAVQSGEPGEATGLLRSTSAGAELPNDQAVAHSKAAQGLHGQPAGCRDSFLPQQLLLQPLELNGARSSDEAEAVPFAPLDGLVVERGNVAAAARSSSGPRDPQLQVSPGASLSGPASHGASDENEAFSFPVTPPSEPAPSTTVFPSWPSFISRKDQGAPSSGYNTDDEASGVSPPEGNSEQAGDMAHRRSVKRTLVDVIRDLEVEGTAASAPDSDGRASPATRPPLPPSHTTAPGYMPTSPAIISPALRATAAAALHGPRDGLRESGAVGLSVCAKPATQGQASDSAPEAPTPPPHDAELLRPAPLSSEPSLGNLAAQEAHDAAQLRRSGAAAAAVHVDAASSSLASKEAAGGGEAGTHSGRAGDDGAVARSRGASASGERPRAAVGTNSGEVALVYEYDPEYIARKYEILNLKVIHRRRRTGFEETKDFPIRVNDLIAGRYQVMDFLGSAAFSKAVQALDIKSGRLVCLKIIKNNKDYFDQSLDEIKLLSYVNAHDPDDQYSMLRLFDFFYYKEHLFLVCELLRANLYEFQKYNRESGEAPYFTLPRVQSIARQVLTSLAFLHSLGLIHSDLKPENILVRSYSRCEVKVIDLGSSCFTSDQLSSYVQSRSYRAPEVILGAAYDQKIDVWSLGCILAELLSNFVLFQNESLATLLARLEGILGPMPPRLLRAGRYTHRYYTRTGAIYERSPRTGWYEVLRPKRSSLRRRVPEADEGCLRFLHCLLTLDPAQRPAAQEALQHPWLTQEYPTPE